MTVRLTTCSVSSKLKKIKSSQNESMIVDQTHLFVILTEANKLFPGVKNRWLRGLGLLRAVMGDENIFSRLLIRFIVVGILIVVEDRSRINTNVHVDCNVKRGNICH